MGMNDDLRLGTAAQVQAGQLNSEQRRHVIAAGMHVYDIDAFLANDVC